MAACDFVHEARLTASGGCHFVAFVVQVLEFEVSEMWENLSYIYATRVGFSIRVANE